MNERIRELMQSADSICNETRGVYDEILAELLVQECLSHLWLHGYDDAAQEIKQHFGIEK